MGFDPSYKNIFIQSATLNGKPYTKNWIDHSFFTEGKELVLTLGAKESAWGTHVADLPPSLGKYSGFGAAALEQDQPAALAHKAAPARPGMKLWQELDLGAGIDVDHMHAMGSAPEGV